MLLFSVYDKKASLAGPLFEAQTLDVAKRMIISSLSPESALVQYPADFSIHVIGDFNRDDCVILADVEGDTAPFPVAVLIPDHLRQYCLDGTFPRGERNETTSQS